MTRLAMRGFSLFELAVVIAVVAILSGILLTRVLPLIGQAERVAFLQTRQQIRSALLLEAAERVVRGESATLASLTGVNPMELMLEPPRNYVGAGPSAGTGAVPRRAWYFDEDDRLLVYKPGRQARFDPLDGPTDRIEMRVSFAYRDRDADGTFDASVDRFDGLRLDSLHLYAWPQ
jgi:prepilin-type N-terminal cleavage/methylation domain-containing protein